MKRNPALASWSCSANRTNCRSLCPKLEDDPRCDEFARRDAADDKQRRFARSELAGYGLNGLGTLAFYVLGREHGRSQSQEDAPVAVGCGAEELS